MAKKKLYLLDAFALIFRGYYALIKNPRINSKGMDTSAILGFMNSLLDVIRREKPDLLAVAFDKGGSVSRTEAFAEYKSNRQETPEAIKIAIPYIHKILEAMQIPIVEVAGFEADDLIGTLAKQAEKQNFEVYMVTPDKDFAQLVSENIFMYKPSRMGNGIEIWDVDKVKEKFEIDDPIQVIDYLGMRGDAVDNIPGLPGVGDKTAKKFIKQYGSMENLLNNTADLKGKMKEKIEANKDLGLLSKKLATIMLDCPVTFNEKNYQLTQPKFQEVNNLFQELEFRRMWNTLNKIFVNPASAEGQIRKAKSSQTKDTGQLDLFASPISENIPDPSGFETIENTPHLYQKVDTHLGRSLFFSSLMKQKVVSFKTIKSSSNILEAELLGIAFSFGKGKGYYLPVPNQSVLPVFLNDLRPFFEDEKIEKIAYNIKDEIKTLYKHNMPLKGLLFDTMIAHYLLQPDMRHDMVVLSESYLKYRKISLEKLIGKKGKNQLTLQTVNIKKLVDYATEEADINFQLKTIFQSKLDDKNLTKLFQDIEMPLTSVLAQMELSGINLDTKFLESLSEQLSEDILNLQNAIFKIADMTFNLASPKQLGEVLFEKLHLIKKPKKTKTGQYATGEAVLSKLAKEHDIVRLIMEWRGLVKLQNTYIEALPKEVNPSTNRIHTTYMQAVASTGRLSSTNPNLQNIPIRTERGRQVRKAFIKRNEDYTLLAADYSQIELRLIAEMSGEPTMKESFIKGEDIHKATAAKVFNIPIDEVTREQRSQAKTVNFGIIYGVSAFGLSEQTSLSRKEAKVLIDAYYDTYPVLKDYISKQVNLARDQMYVETLLGRRRYLKNINSNNSFVRSGDERNAVNAPIQGTAADIIKIAMIAIQKLLDEKNYKTKMLLQVHDELVFDMHKDEKEVLKPLIKNIMENAFKMSIPLVVDMDEGDNWLEAH